MSAPPYASNTLLPEDMLVRGPGRGPISRPTDAAFSVRSGLQLFTQGNGGFLVSPCSTHLHLVGRGPNPDHSR